jgi:hypothetical protein
VIAIDGAVIARGDDHGKPVTQPAGGTSSSSISSGPDATAATGSTTTTAESGSASSTSSAATTDITSSTVATNATTGDVVVAHLQGDGTTPSNASFHVDGHWQLRWRVGQGGNGVAATVDNDDDPNRPELFAGLTPGEGTTDVQTGCNCTLHLTPDGSDYDVEVVDVEG